MTCVKFPQNTPSGRFNILATFNMDEIIDLTWAKYDNRRSETKKHEKSKEILGMKKFTALAMHY